MISSRTQSMNVTIVWMPPQMIQSQPLPALHVGSGSLGISAAGGGALLPLGLIAVMLRVTIAPSGIVPVALMANCGPALAVILHVPAML
ncbi:MAG: hypothetical protein K0S68_631 [Candidatus Saccharibacteria bacterium]|nr:hypothetical protein [Candidatus Saccharibacteria bacterium]